MASVCDFHNWRGPRTILPIVNACDGAYANYGSDTLPRS